MVLESSVLARLVGRCWSVILLVSSSFVLNEVPSVDGADGCLALASPPAPPLSSLPSE